MVILKPGYKTSEFWVTTLASAGALIAACAGELPPRYAVFAAMASQGAYALSRGVAKLGALLHPPTTTTVAK